MIDWQTLQEQTTLYRRTAATFLAGEGPRAHIVPPTWKNNLHWHAGHLVLVPYLLTYGLMREPLPIGEDYRRWFARGTSPAGWREEPIPPFDELVGSMVELIPPLFDSFEGRADAPFPKPYATSAGIVLRSPAESLVFSLGHDGLHTGMIQALKRGLDGMQV